jgi:hypothetical protein
VPDDAGDGWGDLRAALEADLRRVSDRLGGLSAAQLAGTVPPSDDGGPPYWSRAQAARAVAQEMASAAETLERGRDWGMGRGIPELADYAAADQVAVTGHDLIAALDLVAPSDQVAPGPLGWAPARDVVARVARLLADLRRRL